MDPRERLRLSLLGAGCSRCGQPYDEEGIRVLAQRDEIAFVQLVCFACNIQTLALVTGLPKHPDEDEDDGLEEAAARGGEPARSLRRRANRPISEDDVLEMRRYLADYQGDMKNLLRKNGDGDDGHHGSNGNGRNGRHE